jgi:hypothetical protein
MGFMRSRLLQTVAAVAAVAIVAPALKLGVDGRAGARATDGTLRISSEERAASARFAPAVPAKDREWIEAAVATARPEAQRLIAEVDGLVEYRVHHGDPFAVTQSNLGPRGASFVLSFDIGSLDRTRTQDRNGAVLHEYGHVVDLALVPPQTNATLEAGIPRTGSCTNWGGGLTGACAEPAERFADTFAKWALRGHFSVVGAGYAVAVPPSLEDWGAPLGAIANQLPAG